MSQRDTADADLPLPLATRHDAAVQGPLVAGAPRQACFDQEGRTHPQTVGAGRPSSQRWVELAPGLVAPQPKSFTAARVPMWESEQIPTPPAVRSIVSGYGHARVADAADTGHRRECRCCGRRGDADHAER